MQFDIFNRYTKVSDATEKEIQLLKEWCIKEYEYYSLDFSRRPVRRRKKMAYLSYFEGAKFPTGWVGTFTRRFKDLGYQIKCCDNRIKPLKTDNTNIGHNIPPLRDYQQTAHDLALLNTRGIIHHCTGAGKTIVMAKLLETLQLQSIIIVPTLNLLMQISDEFKKFFGEDYVGIIGEGTYDPKLFTVATIQSLWSLIKQNDFNLKTVTSNTQVLMIDECLPDSALITLEDKTKIRLKDLLKNLTNREILSYNYKSEALYKSSITKITSKGRERIYKFNIKCGSNRSYILRCSGGHKIWVNGVWKKAKNIKLGDKVLCLN